MKVCKIIETKVAESRKLRAQCHPAKAQDLRDGLSVTETNMGTKLDGWNALAFSETTADEDYYKKLQAAKAHTSSAMATRVLHWENGAGMI